MASSLKNAGRSNSSDLLITEDTQVKTFTSSTTVVAPVIEKVLLPTQVIEKKVAIHEEIRTELVEEVQPIVNIEKLKTEVHQVTQPLFDKEVKPVLIEKKLLSTEIMPEVHIDGRGTSVALEKNTTTFLPSSSVTIEKPAMYTEIEKKQIIQEIQPVLYKETIVPTVIEETKPMYQKIVEGPVYSQSTLVAKGTRSVEEMTLEAERNAYKPSTVVVAPVLEKVRLPTQVIEKSVAVHEEIRKELVEEIQPVINVEKFKTEVHQVTAPLFDKEIKPVLIEKKLLATEILPEVHVEGRGVVMAAEMSTTKVLPTSSVTIEKPAMFTEVEKTQIIEEVQSVIYKETVVPTVIQETKPMYQKIVEGPVYSQEVLSTKNIASLRVQPEAYKTSTEVIAPVHSDMMLPVKIVEKEATVHEEIRREMVEEIQPVVSIEKLSTEVHQVTQPLFDKEIKPVLVQKKLLATEILPEVHVEGRGVSLASDVSTTKYLETETVLIEKPAMYVEIEKTQVIEEVQSIIYKETIVPTVIQETKPMYQKIVEGPVFTHTTLAPQSLNGTHFKYPASYTSTTTTTVTTSTDLSKKL